MTALKSLYTFENMSTRSRLHVIAFDHKDAWDQLRLRHRNIYNYLYIKHEKLLKNEISYNTRESS